MSIRIEKLGFSLVAILPIAFTSLYFSFNDGPCQNLSNWLKAIGFTYIAISVLIGISSALKGQFLAMVAVAGGIFTMFILWIIGLALVLSKKNSKCVSETVGIVTIINLGLIGCIIGILCLLSGLGKPT